MKVRISHLPTWLLVIGYPVFWGEMFFHHNSHTSYLAPFVFAMVLVACFTKAIRGGAPWPLFRINGFFESSWMALGGAILFIAGLAALLPPHLLQEWDALNYHFSLPRQHLIKGSFAHLPWSAADLWLLPIQFSLAPYWFSTTLPNKLPQYIFLWGILLIAMKLGHHLGMSSKSRAGLIAAILGSHGLAIQFGTAMLDIAIVYLGLAMLESILCENWPMAAIEGSFFVWSKSFMPLQVSLILAAFMILELIRRQLGFRWTLSFSLLQQPIDSRLWKRFGVGIVAGALMIGGPFMAKSLYYAGTPLFPFRPFQFGGALAKDPIVKDSVIQASTEQQGTRNAYGNGRSLPDFIHHFWWIAVPMKGVNNVYDYPLGLPYLLLLGPFLVLLIVALRRRQFPFLPILVLVLWAIWWAGSQQSRWLYLPILLIMITTMSVEDIASNRILGVGLICALFLTAMSIFRAQWPDIHRHHQAIRPQDLQLIEESKLWKGSGPLRVSWKEIAFAECPVEVVSPDSYWILRISKND